MSSSIRLFPLSESNLSLVQGVDYLYNPAIDRTTIIGEVSDMVKTELEKQAKAADIATDLSRPFARFCSKSQDVGKFTSHLLASASLFALEQCLKDEGYPQDLKSGVSAVLTQYKDKIPDIFEGPGHIHEWEKRIGYLSIVSAMKTHRRDQGRRDAQKTYKKYLDDYCVDVLGLQSSEVPGLEDEEMVSDLSPGSGSYEGEGSVEYTGKVEACCLPPDTVKMRDARVQAGRPSIYDPAEDHKWTGDPFNTQVSDAKDNSGNSQISGATIETAVQSGATYKGKGKGKAGR